MKSCKQRKKPSKKKVRRIPHTDQEIARWVINILEREMKYHFASITACIEALKEI